MIKNQQIINQQNHFDFQRNQYDSFLINNPPLHTRLEIDYILKRLKKTKLKKDSYIVDFGAGSGRLTIPLLQNDYSVLAVDVSKHSLKILKNNTGLLSSKLQTSQTFPEVSETYQAITGTDILHHINLDYYLPLFHKALTKKGKILFSEPGGLNPSWYIYLSVFASWGIEKGVVNCTFNNLKKKLKQYGFRNINIKGLGLFPRPFFNFSNRICQLNDLLGDAFLLKYFAYRYIIEAAK